MSERGLNSPFDPDVCAKCRVGFPGNNNRPFSCSDCDSRTHRKCVDSPVARRIREDPVAARFQCIRCRPGGYQTPPTSHAVSQLPSVDDDAAESAIRSSLAIVQTAHCAAIFKLRWVSCLMISSISNVSRLPWLTESRGWRTSLERRPWVLPRRSGPASAPLGTHRGQGLRMPTPA